MPGRWRSHELGDRYSRLLRGVIGFRAEVIDIRIKFKLGQNERDDVYADIIAGLLRNLQESFRLTCHPRFPHDLARIIHNADARLLDRYVESSKIVHAALLLLMLEAVYADLVSPSA